MTQLLAVLHGKEETFPPALVSEINSRQKTVRAEIIEVASVEALERSPFRWFVDRISSQVGYFASLLRQQQLLGAGCSPSLELQTLDRVGLAQLALQARVACLPTILLPHHSHPVGVVGEDLGNLAYPMPWETYVERVGLPGALRPAGLGQGPAQTFNSLSELWHLYGRSGDRLQVVQPDVGEGEHCMVLPMGDHWEVLGYDPIRGSYRPLPEGQQQAARKATQPLSQRLDLFLCGVEWVWHRSKLWLYDLHRCPNLDWWSLGEEPFQLLVESCARECIARIRAREKGTSKTRTPSPAH